MSTSSTNCERTDGDGAAEETAYHGLDETLMANTTATLPPAADSEQDVAENADDQEYDDNNEPVDCKNDPADAKAAGNDDEPQRTAAAAGLSLANGTDNASCASDSSPKSNYNNQNNAMSTSTNNNNSMVYLHLSDGFQAVRQRRDRGPSDAMIRLERTPDFLTHACVNCIDPSSHVTPSSPSRSSSSHPSSKTKKPKDLYTKLLSILEKDYNSTLRHVPFQHFRSGANGVIDSLVIQTYLTSSQGLVWDRDPHVPWAGAGPSGKECDAMDWHNAPYCHVYLAPCESLEEYRTKVKPSIQAFLSQIEASSKQAISSSNGGGVSSSGGVAATGGGGTSGGGGAGSAGLGSTSSYSTGPHYVIVFVPCGPRPTGSESADTSTTTTTTAAGIGRMGAFASRVVGGRQRLASNIARELTGSDSSSTPYGTVDTTTNTSGDVDLDGSDVGGASGQQPQQQQQQSALGHLSKIDKEILRRFVADFPRGRVCVLSTLFDPNSSNDDDDDDQDHRDYDDHRELQRLEWSVFLSQLGAAIAGGFRERCGCYDGELRRLDQLRGLSAMGKAGPEDFDVAYFFLVKESLAFTYEQMCLPSEALIQYDEVDAILPDLNETRIPEEDSDQVKALNFSESAMAGDSIAFRKGIRLIKDLQSIAHFFQIYLFARETSLLFKMNRSVEVMERCYDFVRRMYKCRRNSVREDDRNALIRVEKWAFEFCWDVKKACDIYLADDVTFSESMHSSVHAGESEPRRSRRIDEALARCVCNVLEFARLRMLRLGDLSLEQNPARVGKQSLQEDMKKARTPWKPRTKKGTSLRGLASLGGASEHSLIGTSQHSGLGSIGEEDEMSTTGTSVYSSTSSEHFVEDAVKSSTSFIALYLDVIKILISYNQFSGRKRCAARLCLEMADIYSGRGEREKATLVLRSAADPFWQDRWQSNHFLILFRLACFQREHASAADYLQTLVQCFSPLHARAAPAKALSFLMSDLQAVLKSSGGPRHRLDSVPMFDPVLSLEDPQASLKTGSERGDLLKKMYAAGDKASLRISLKSYLPTKVEIDCICIDLVPFREYMTAIEDSTVVRDESLYRVLTFEGPLTVEPGVNEFSFHWVPMVSGQFIMSSLTIHWSSVRFYYLAKSSRRPTIRVDILPAEPTQSLKFTPDYLIPSHEQPLKVTFMAGTDIVKEARLKLFCSPGVLLLPPGEASESDKWCSSAAFPVPHCLPGEAVDVTTMVKCMAPEDRETGPSDQGSHSVQATITSLYRRPYPDGDGCVVSVRAYGDDEEPALSHTLESTIATLDKRAMTIESQYVSPYSLDRTMLSLTLQCNTPTSVVLKKWKLSLPLFLSLADDRDLNEFMVDTRLYCGEQVTLSFECHYVEGSDGSGSNESFLEVDLLDEYSYTFTEKIHLKLKRPTVLRSGLPILKCIPITVKPSSLTGLVGSPVTVVYDIETRELNDVDKRICYDVNADSDDWIISGKRQGLLRSNGDSKFALEIVAIPTRPGAIHRYPLLSLCLVRDDCEDLVGLTTTERSTPESFVSLSADMHSTIAVPMIAKKSL